MSGNPVIFATVVSMLGVILVAIPPCLVFLLLSVFYADIGDRR